MKESIYFDHEPTGVANINRSILFGEGVFETFRYKNKLPVMQTLIMNIKMRKILRLMK